MTSAITKPPPESQGIAEPKEKSAQNTPSFRFSLARVRNNAATFRALCTQEFASTRYEAYFPIKVAPSTTIVQCLQEFQFGFEVINQSTAAIARAAVGSKTILSGPAKTEALISSRQATDPWSYISCESLTDLQRINAGGERSGCQVPVLLRIKATEKRRLGMSIDDARWSVIQIQHFPFVKLVGIHIHSGSNLSVREADLTVERMKVVAVDLHRFGLNLEVLNFGGGLPCINGQTEETARRLSCFAQLADALGAGLILEPGRALVGDAAALIAEVTDVRLADREITINSASYVVHGPCNADKFILHQRSGETQTNRYEVVSRKEANFRVGGIWPAEGDSLWLKVAEPRFGVGDRIIFPHAGAYTLGFLGELSFDELVPSISD